MTTSLVIHDAWPLMGGLEKVCLRVAQELRASGDSCQIIALSTRKRIPLNRYFVESEIERSFDNEGVPTTVLGFGFFTKILWGPLFKLIWRPSTLPLARKLYNMIMVPKVLRACQGSDRIHYFGNGAEMLGFSSAAAARQLGIPLIIEPALHQGQWGDSWIDLTLYRFADILVAHTEHEKQVLIDMGLSGEKVRVVTHGVDAPHGGNGQRFRTKHRIGDPMILFLGRKTAEKGVYQTIEGFKALRQSIPNIRLVLAGPYEGKAPFEIPEGAIDLDDISESDKQDALAACDLLCVPSKGESFGMVYFEAWGYGKPVIALDLPTLQETIGKSKGGILISADIEETTSAMAMILTNPTRASSMGKSGQEMAEKHLWSSAITSYRNIYTELED